jgi:hypothetical protein
MASEQYYHVHLKVHTNVSEKHTASKFSPKDWGSKFLQNSGVYL